MLASIVLNDLSWSTPDGRPLLDSLTLSVGPGRTGLVGRNGVGKSTLLKIIAGELSPSRGTVACTARLAMLRQSVQVDPRESLADAFAIREELAVLRAIEAGTAEPEALAEADWTLEPRFQAALARVGLPEMAPEQRLAVLSGGQRTRAFLAALVFREPDMILLDEPTNNLDREGRAAVAELLAGWRRGALVVSHDRDLLERMDAIVELTGLGARTYGGNWSHYRARKAVELEAASQRLDTAERRLEAIDRRNQAAKERKARRDAAGRRKRAKGDTPKIVLDAQQQRAERSGGADRRMGERLRQAAAEDAEAARQEVETLKTLSVALPSTGLHRGKTVVDLQALTGGYDPSAPVIRDLDLTLVGPERVAVTGPNGAGKTTLFKLATGRLAPFAGKAWVCRRHAVLDQTVSLLDPALSVRENFLRLNPGTEETACRAALARFLFPAETALKQVGGLSGGEMLRAGLASVLGGSAPPQLLLLDEPTNHLDIDSLQAMEAGLAAYDGALLVISHDPAFLRAVGVTRRVNLPGGTAAEIT